MGFQSVISTAHSWVRERVQPGDSVIDATLGGGVDARFLAELIGPRGMLTGFDIQEDALRRTEERLAPLAASGKLPRLSLHLRSHEDMADVVPVEARGRIAAVLFNLGYLPGNEADQSIVTLPASTLLAMEAGLELLRPGGILACVLYPGHPGGDAEAQAVLAWASALPAEAAQCVLYRLAQKPAAPFALGIEKKT